MPKNTYSDEFKADAVRLYEPSRSTPPASEKLSRVLVGGTLGSEKDGDLS